MRSRLGLGLAAWLMIAVPAAAQLATAPCVAPVHKRLAGRLACMTMTLPVDPAVPGGMKLRMPVVRIAAERPDAGALPLLFMMGGNGDGLELLKSQGAMMAGMARRRDLIVYDHRGAGFAKPLLSCGPGIDAVALANGPPAPRRACAAKLRAAGIDIDRFGPDEAAGDLAALRQALGLAQWDVYGVSYGAGVALRLIARDRAGVRALVLDGVTGGDNNAWSPAVSIDPILDSIDGCKAQPDCAAAFPDLDDDLAAAVTRVQNGHGGGAGAATMQDFATPIYIALSNESRRLVPLAIHRVAAGDFSVWRRLASPPSAAPGAAEPAPPGFEGLTMFGSVCRIEWPRRRDPGLNEPRRPGPAALRTVSFEGSVVDWDAFCRDFEFARAPDSLAAQVKSDVPVIILNGERDIGAPATWAARVLSGMSAGRMVDFAQTGHFVAIERTDCAMAVIDGFLVDPAASLALDCVARLPRTVWAVTG